MLDGLRRSGEREQLENSLAGQFFPNEAAAKVLLESQSDTSAAKTMRSTISAQFCDAIERAMMWAFYGSSMPSNYYILGNYAPVEEFGPERVVTVRGYLPVSASPFGTEYSQHCSFLQRMCEASAYFPDWGIIASLRYHCHSAAGLETTFQRILERTQIFESSNDHLNFLPRTENSRPTVHLVVVF